MKKIVPILLVVAVLLVGGMAVYRRTAQKISSPALSELPRQTGTSSDTETTSESTYTPQVGTKEITLTIASPTNGSTVTTPTIAVLGKTVARAEVFINEYEMKADASGNFSYNVPLDEGENIIIVVVNDEDGNLAEEELIVNYEPTQ